MGTAAISLTASTEQSVQASGSITLAAGELACMRLSDRSALIDAWFNFTRNGVTSVEPVNLSKGSAYCPIFGSSAGTDTVTLSMVLRGGSKGAVMGVLEGVS